MSDWIKDEIEEIDSTSTAIVHDFIAEVEAMPAGPPAFAAGARHCYIASQDGNGTISKDELRAVLESFGEKPDEDDLQKMMKECDSNDSDTIDFQEFCTLMVTRMNDIDDPIVLEEAFKMFDKDGNGQISRAELRLAFQNILQTTEEDLPLTEMEDMLREFDRNGDGSINFAEFKQYMMED
eukprot:jgi/Chrpa1/26927/Chrysochromulina_OHIO_Genome00014071-RA